MELTDKVAINNLCGWALYFKRENGVGDIRIPANAKNFSQNSCIIVNLGIYYKGLCKAMTWEVTLLWENFH